MKKKILIVEDIELHQDRLIQVLEEEYDVITAFDGAEGIKFAHQERPDLILMDLSLTGLNGLQATRQIKSRPECVHIPIIALLSQTTRSIIKEATAAGCADYLTKPVGREPLEAMLRKYLS